MKIVLVFLSPNTTTKGVSEELKRVLTLDGHKAITLNIGEKANREFDKINFQLFEGADLIGIGCPIYHLTLVEPMERFLQFALPRLSKMSPGIEAFMYFTYSGITTEKAFANAASLLEKNHIALVGQLRSRCLIFWMLTVIRMRMRKELLSNFDLNCHNQIKIMFAIQGVSCFRT